MIKAIAGLIREEGVSGVSLLFINAAYTYLFKLASVFSRSQGREVFEEEWDVLVILDACRHDLMKEVVEEEDYKFLKPVDSCYSAAGTSDEWMNKNFGEKHYEKAQRTAMVTGNPYSDTNLDEKDFEVLEEAWEYSYDKEKEAVLPRPITNSAIRIQREENPDKMVIHYMQPHYPFLNHDNLSEGFSLEGFGKEIRKSVWDELLLDNITREELWEAYKDNLKEVIEEVNILRKNMDADKMVITADHGNAIGTPLSEEKFIYGHVAGLNIEPLRKVPWIETTATDTGEKLSKNKKEENKDKEEVVKEALADLGYNT